MTISDPNKIKSIARIRVDSSYSRLQPHLPHVERNLVFGFHTRVLDVHGYGDGFLRLGISLKLELDGLGLELLDLLLGRLDQPLLELLSCE